MPILQSGRRHRRYVRAIKHSHTHRHSNKTCNGRTPMPPHELAQVKRNIAATTHNHTLNTNKNNNVAFRLLLSARTRASRVLRAHHMCLCAYVCIAYYTRDMLDETVSLSFYLCEFVCVLRRVHGGTLGLAGARRSRGAVVCRFRMRFMDGMRLGFCWRLAHKTSTTITTGYIKKQD